MPAKNDVTAQRSSPAFLRWIGNRILASSFEILYHQLAPAYDLVSWVVSGGQWRAWQLASLIYLPRGRVLEVGPGPGHLLVDLLASGRDAYGVDLSTDMLRIARRRLHARGYRGRLIAGDARYLPFADETFDAVVLTFPAPFLDCRFWSEANRVLRRGGVLVAVLGASSNRWPWPGLLEWGLGRLAGNSAFPDRDTMTLASTLVGKLVDQPVGQGVARLLVASRCAEEVGHIGGS